MEVAFWSKWISEHHQELKFNTEGRSVQLEIKMTHLMTALAMAVVVAVAQRQKESISGRPDDTDTMMIQVRRTTECTGECDQKPGEARLGRYGTS